MALTDLITIETTKFDKNKKNNIRKLLTNKHGGIINISLNQVDGIKFIGDFYGLLNANDVPKHLWLEVMILNNIESSSSYDGSLTSIRSFDLETIKRTNI